MKKRYWLYTAILAMQTFGLGFSCGMLFLIKDIKSVEILYENKEILVWKMGDTSWESPKLTDYREEFMRLPGSNG